MNAIPSTACTLTFVWTPNADYEFVNALRTEHYPAELLYNAAHIGVFTRVTVPSALLEQAKSDIRNVAAQHRAFDFKFQPTVALFGKCVVLRVNRNQPGRAFLIRNQLNDRWAHAGFVDPQERNPKSYQPHVTIHARVSKQEAQRVFPLIASAFESRAAPQGRITGINLWEYKEGQPWILIEFFPFGG